MTGKQISRRQSRRKAFELLFELECRPALTAEAILQRTFDDEEVAGLFVEDADGEGYVTGFVGPNSQRFIGELVRAVKLNQARLDRELEQYPRDWSYDRIGLTERVLLRLALAEMWFIGTSHKVVINEALDMAKQYAQEDAGPFINGILGSAVRNLDKLRAEAGGESDAGG